jgi:hypothetical protein
MLTPVTGENPAITLAALVSGAPASLNGDSLSKFDFAGE